jgi:hypothetical protein
MFLQRMKALESMRLRAEGSLREELDGRWQKLKELTEERMRTLWAQHEVRWAWASAQVGRWRLG